VASNGSLSGTPSDTDEGLNVFIVQASDGMGGTDQATLNIAVTVPAPSVDQLATGQILTWGSVAGTYADTHSNGGSAQSITEASTGGSKSVRTSRLQFDWIFNVEPGVVVTLFANAWAPGSADGDDFRMSYSTDGNSFTPIFLIGATSDGDIYQTFGLPSTTSGTVYVRVEDTDRSGGNYAKDTVYVDHLFIRTDRESSGTPPDAPSGLTAEATSSSTIDLNWDYIPNDELGFHIEQSLNGTSDWTQVATVGADSTSHTVTGLSAGTTYYFRVQAYNGAGTSSFSGPVSDTTDTAPEPIHVAGLSGSSTGTKKWVATATIQIEDAGMAPISSVTVTGSWSAGGSGSCTTNGSGQCSITKGNLRGNLPNVTFTVTNATHSERAYDPGANLETSIVISKP
jgi:hypothetical protein